MKEVAEMPQNIYMYMYIDVGGCIFWGRFETRGLSMPLTVLKRSVKLLNECERRRATPISLSPFSLSLSPSFTISICAKLLIKKLSRHARLADFFSARYSSIQFNSIESYRIASNGIEFGPVSL